MKKPSKGGGERTKGRRPKMPKPTRRNALKVERRSKPSSVAEEKEVARFVRERDEALEQQAATSEVLNVISRSTFDLPTALNTLVETAARLCRADKVQILLPSENTNRVYLAASFGYSAEYNEFIKTITFAPGREGVAGRVLVERKPVQIADVLADPEYRLREFQRLGGFRTHLGLPLLRKDSVIGVLLVSRAIVEPFDDKHIKLLSTFAAQAVIAIENARLLTELRQSLQQQTATSEVLQVISSSPGALEPVFATMLQKAVRICDARYGSLYLHEDGKLRLVAAHDVPEFLEARRGVAFEPAPGGGLDEAMRTMRAVQIPDLAATKAYMERHPGIVEAVELAGIRTGMAVPMLKDDEVIGVIAIHRREVLPFTEKQVELLTNFAAQAVIAIENARLLSELRQSLEDQTATSEVLQVISSSSGDLQPVFASILENATRICEANFGVLVLYENAAFHVAANHNAPPAFVELRQRQPTIRASGALARVVAAKQLVHILDCLDDASYKQGDADFVRFVDLCRVRSLILAPMLKEAELIGVIGIYRTEVRPFADKQIALVQNFANQAVIAIENARLLNELRGALERQTATSEVLQVISSSSGDLEPVFETMLANAVRICDAKFGNIYRWDDDQLHLIAMHNTPPAFAEARRRSPHRRVDMNRAATRMLETKAPVQVIDAAAQPGYLDRSDLAVVEAVELGGVRTLLGVPMLKENELIGAFTLYRQEVRPFTEKQIALLTNFAAQAVIAIENARLLNELRQRTTDLTERTADLTEALEQQTATSEVLQVISSSPGDLQSVFQAMLEKAVRICDAKFGSILRWDNEVAHLVATHNAPPAFAEARRRSQNPANPKTSFGRMVATKAVVHVADAAAEPGYVELHDPAAVAAVELGGQRTALYVPMLKESELIGAFTLSRQEVRPFSDKQIELVQNFAAQAVIAIENTRLFNELRQSLEQQTATSDVLRVISSSPGELEPAFQAMLENAVRICDAEFGNIYRAEADGLRLVASHNTPTIFAEALRNSGPQNPVRLMMKKKALVHVADVAATEAYAEREPIAVAAVELGGTRTLIIVPMLKDNELVGAFTLARQEVRPFTDKQIALVTSFAAQAVIAIENERLLQELRERTNQLEAQSQEVVKLNQQLEQRVADQVGEIERMGRLRRFLPPQVADLIVASGSEKQLESHGVQCGRHRIVK